MKHWLNSLGQLLGGSSSKPDPEEISESVLRLHEEARKKRNQETLQNIQEARTAKASEPKKWRRRRWAVLISANLFFLVSYRLDIQALEGALTGSRFVGFHMVDLNSALQVMLAFKHVLINLLIGIVTVFILWFHLGGRSFCSWVCPYHLVSEWAEFLHLALARKKIVKDHLFDRRARVWLWIVFALLAFITNYTVFETISPTGILSRALIYGPSTALAWVLALLLIEVFYSRRAWCRYACPIGLTYGMVGLASPLRVTHNLGKCHNDGACREVCLVPHVLDMTRRGRARTVNTDVGADCTRCGMCLDACPTGALTFKYKGIGKLS